MWNVEPDFDGAARSQQGRPNLIRQPENIGGLVEVEVTIGEHGAIGLGLLGQKVPVWRDQVPRHTRSIDC